MAMTQDKRERLSSAINPQLRFKRIAAIASIIAQSSRPHSSSVGIEAVFAAATTGEGMAP